MKDDFSRRPIRNTIIVVIAATVFSESVAMLILHHTDTPHTDLVLIDSIFIVFFMLPILYFFVYRPMRNYVEKLRKSNEEIKRLRGMLPICATCKKIRDDQGYWKQIEIYISEHSGATFTHGICDECLKEYYKELEKLDRQ